MTHNVYFDNCPRARASLVSKGEGEAGKWRIEMRASDQSLVWEQQGTRDDMTLDECENYITQCFSNRNLT